MSYVTRVAYLDRDRQTTLIELRPPYKSQDIYVSNAI